MPAEHDDDGEESPRVGQDDWQAHKVGEVEPLVGQNDPIGQSEQLGESNALENVPAAQGGQELLKPA